MIDAFKKYIEDNLKELLRAEIAHADQRDTDFIAKMKKLQERKDKNLTLRENKKLQLLALP
jgi:hypothetical protein